MVPEQKSENQENIWHEELSRTSAHGSRIIQSHDGPFDKGRGRGRARASNEWTATITH